MVNDVKFSLTGVDELVGKLREVSDDVRYKGGRFATRKGAQVIQRRAKENAAQLDDPDTAANIAATVAVRWSSKRFKRTGDLMFRIGVMGGAGGNKSSGDLSGLPGGDTRHWRYLEFGSENTRPQPLLREAATSTVNEVIDEIVKQYPKAMDRALRRAKKVKP